MDKNAHSLQLTEGYRVSRRNTSIVCAIALAWSASQFDIKALSLDTIGSVDLTNATIPLILAITAIYTFLRSIIEYAMQPKLVRQWKLAQIDFKLLVWLVRATALALGVSGLSRSLEAIGAAAILMLVLLVVALVFWFVGTLALTPLFIMMHKKYRRSYSPVPHVMDAMGLSGLLVGVSLCIAFIGLGMASLYYEPLRLHWLTVPSHISVTIAVLTAIAVVLSIAVQEIWYPNLFAYEPDFTTTRLPDGTIGVTFHKPPFADHDTPPQNSTVRPTEWPG